MKVPSEHSSEQVRKQSGLQVISPEFSEALAHGEQVKSVAIRRPLLISRLAWLFGLIYWNVRNVKDSFLWLHRFFHNRDPVGGRSCTVHEKTQGETQDLELRFSVLLWLGGSVD